MQELFLHKGIESQILFFIVIGKKTPLQYNWSQWRSFSFVYWWNRAQL